MDLDPRHMLPRFSRAERLRLRLLGRALRWTIEQVAYARGYAAGQEDAKLTVREWYEPAEGDH